MPHPVIPHTGGLSAALAAGGTDMPGPSRALAATMLAERDEADKPAFPPGGVRMLAYRASGPGAALLH